MIQLCHAQRHRLMKHKDLEREGAIALPSITEHAAFRFAASEWNTISPEARHILRDILFDHRQDLRDRYLAYMANDEEISQIIRTDLARQEFAEVFMRWIDDLLTLDPSAVDAFCDHQVEVGQMMARIGVQPPTVSRAMRKLKLWFVQHLGQREYPTALALETVRCMIVMIDLSLEIRESSYQADRSGQARIAEAYRLQALGQNLAMERERQRAALMEWSQHLLTSFYQIEDSQELPLLGKSDFGLWLNHKARIIFDGADDVHLILDAVNRIDEEMIPSLAAASYSDRGLVGLLIGSIQQEVAAIKFGLNALFEARLEIENGRDQLTHLLNRRFLPTVLMREIALQKLSNDQGFCVAMLDIDRFKAINDHYGHLAGDAVLQQVAAIVTECARPSDFIFRYGGEEILLVLIDCNQIAGEKIAERIRVRIADHIMALPNEQQLSVTASLGVAAHAGELDYEKLLARADGALYAAKADGRNRVIIAPNLTEHV